MSRSVCMLLHKSVVHDSRVRREAKALSEAGHAVTVLELAPVSASEGSMDGFRRRSVIPAGWVRRLPFQLYRLIFAVSFVRALVAERPEVIHAHDAAMLLPGLIGARLTGALLVYDSHELATEVPYRDGRWAWFVRTVERLAVPRSAAVITVSDGIAERLRDLYRLRVLPAVVRNMPDVGVVEYDDRLRTALAADDAPIVLHQGSAASGRGADVLVRAMVDVPHARLAFLGPAPDERSAMRGLAAELGVAERVHVLDPVPVEELLSWTAGADVGVSLLQDTCDNHRLALPNKVFEYLAAGVPVVVSDLPELRRMVHTERIGWVADGSNPASVAAALRNALARRGDDALHRRLASTRKRLRWAVERDRLLDVYRRLELHSDRSGASD